MTSGNGPASNGPASNGPASNGPASNGSAGNGSAGNDAAPAADVINRVAAGPPADGGHRLTVIRLDGATSLPLADLHARAGLLARGLHAAGLRRGDRIGILAANCLEWVLLDLAALRLGAITAGFEPGKFDPDPALLAKYSLAALFTDRPPSGPTGPTGPDGADGADGPYDPDRRRIRPVTDVRALIDAGLAAPDGPPSARYQRSDITTIKFTSGSTGEPKGLAATAGSIDASIGAVQAMFGHGAGDDLFVFLPLSLLQQRYWIYSALRYGHDVTVTSYEVAFPALRRAAPTVVMGVPGFYEAARGHIERAAGGPDGIPAAARALFGDRIRYLWTGSAPARRSTLRFFAEAGLPIYEGYGLNETCIVAKNYPGAHREGSVGRVLPGKQVLFDADGVISVRSEHPVNIRYEYAAPGESERVFGPDGTVRTGDLGYLDDDGFLFILGRADDVIVLDNGRKVIVAPIEERLKSSPLIEECVICCPAQTRLVAIVSPAGPPAGPPADPAAIGAAVAQANASLAPDEQVSGVVIACERFSVGNGLLSGQFKPRRRAIEERYRRAIAAVPPGGCLTADGQDHPGGEDREPAGEAVAHG